MFPARSVNFRRTRASPPTSPQLRGREKTGPGLADVRWPVEPDVTRRISDFAPLPRHTRRPRNITIFPPGVRRCQTSWERFWVSGRWPREVPLSYRTDYPAPLSDSYPNRFEELRAFRAHAASKMDCSFDDIRSALDFCVPAGRGSPSELDDFMMYKFKVEPCHKKYRHEWRVCPYAHEGETAKRRDPRTYSYQPSVCPIAKKEQKCVRGDACPHAHNVFEYWLHPLKYKTELCSKMDGCDRVFCFFAHSKSELRSIPEEDLGDDLMLSLCSLTKSKDADAIGPVGGVCGMMHPASNRLVQHQESECWITAKSPSPLSDCCPDLVLDAHFPSKCSPVPPFGLDRVDLAVSAPGISHQMLTLDQAPPPPPPPIQYKVFCGTSCSRSCTTPPLGLQCGMGDAWVDLQGGVHALGGGFVGNGDQLCGPFFAPNNVAFDSEVCESPAIPQSMQILQNLDKSRKIKLFGR